MYYLSPKTVANIFGLHTFECLPAILTINPCLTTGQILEQVSVGFVCPRGVRGQVCRRECLRASCPAHPDAVCVADPCNECRVNFYR